MVECHAATHQAALPSHYRGALEYVTDGAIGKYAAAQADSKTEK